MTNTDEPTQTTFPLKEFIGFSIERRESGAVTSVELDERHMNPNSVAHGAIAFTLMDTAMGAAVMSVVEEGKFCATIEMQTRFHRPASGGRLTAEATILNAGRRVIHLRAETTGEDGRLVASATASFAVI